MPSLSTLTVLLSAAATTLAGHTFHARSHNDLAKRMESQLTKRFYAPRITWYPTDTGPDACTGKNHGDYDNIVAMNVPQFQGSCGKSIKITANGVSAIGVVQDECASCPIEGQIDLTKGLFEKFASLDQGVFTGTWEFVNGDGSDSGDSGDNSGSGDDGDDTKKTTKKTTTHHETPTPEKLAAPKTTKKTTTHHTSTSTHHSSSIHHSSSVHHSSTSTLAVPSSDPTPVTYPSQDVGNVGADPSASAEVNGGIASDGNHSNGAASVTFNMLLAGAATLLTAIQAL